MLIKAEVITYCNQWPITENLGIRCEHHLQTSAEIQVFIARSTNECMSPNGVTIVSESPHMIVDQACPRIFACIHTNTAMNGSFYINRNIIACLINEQQYTWAYRHLHVWTNLITYICKETTIHFGTDKEASSTSIVLCQRRNSHHSYCQN